MAMALIMATTGCYTGPRGFGAPGIENFDRVDTKLYRGAQPSALDLQWLRDQGVTLVVNLRHDPWAREAEVCKELGMAYHHVPMAGVGTPARQQVDLAIDLLERHQGKAFVHCLFGCDRTGVVVACWQISHRMDPATALDDAVKHGLSKLLPDFRAFILSFRQ